MKKTMVFLCSLLLLTTIAIADTHIPAGTVSGRWTLANSPYIIDGEILILDVDRLRIEPGVEVQFSGHYKFSVYGRLLAEGTATDTITFTAQDTTVGWGGIRFRHMYENGVDSSKVDYCKLEYGKAMGSNPDYRGGAVYCENSSDILIRHCLIENNSALSSGGGIYLRNSNITIENVILSHNESSGYGGGIYMYNLSYLVLVFTHLQQIYHFDRI
jgi:parallel beta-helix repeat protein